MSKGIIDLYFEIKETCNHKWESEDNPFGHLLYCTKCGSYLVNGRFEI